MYFVNIIFIFIKILSYLSCSVQIINYKLSKKKVKL